MIFYATMVLNVLHDNTPRWLNSKELQCVNLKYWCGREDSNFHGSYPTATSTLRVYHSATAAHQGTLPIYSGFIIVKYHYAFY